MRPYGERRFSGMTLGGPMTFTLPRTRSGRVVVEDVLCRLLAMSPNDAPAEGERWTLARWAAADRRIARRVVTLRAQWPRVVEEP
jgi:hypothetical protein